MGEEKKTAQQLRTKLRVKQTTHSLIMREAAACSQMKPKPPRARAWDHAFERGPYGVCRRCGEESHDG